MTNGKSVTKYAVPSCVEVLNLILLGNIKHSVRSIDIAKSWYSSMHPDYRNTPDVTDEIRYISGHIGRSMLTKLKKKGIASKQSRTSYAVDFDACDAYYKELVASKQDESTAVA
ncbi:MAG: hypothetical protein KAJ91_02020 [Candidatus Aenigmarchaeota archaeon]|nr:hypothetical protein [Candidatus Aenigmarchaeota archaeon]MCK5333404.1 hypothetical protein [Candidatus Aenigmarchaeota archaeon]